MNTAEVDAWFAGYENPMKPVVAEMRSIILAADARLAECIKWQAPTFTYEGNMASFFPRSKKQASLMFHQGAIILGDFPNLTGDGKEARSFKVASLDDLADKQAELQAICRAWCDQRDAAKA